MFSSICVYWFSDQLLKGIFCESYFDCPRYITTKVLVAVAQHHVYRKNKNQCKQKTRMAKFILIK